MRNDTRRLYTAYEATLARLNGVDRVDRKFNVSPSIQQKLESKIQHSSEFLTRINIVPVTELEGEKIGLGISGPVASTTDTNERDRTTSDLITLDNQRYRCEKTDFDTHITYQRLDTWAKFPDFQTRIRDAILRRQALDRIMIGFRGEMRADNSNRGAYPMLEDVNKGWLVHLRERASQRVMTHGKAGGKIVIAEKSADPDRDYTSLDALVFDMTTHLLAPWHAEDPELVVICGRELLADKYFPLINRDQPPSEKLAADLIVSQKRIGNLPAVRVPFFPPKSLLITRLDNLSIYYQEGARRRTVVDNAKRDRIENYESSNDAYVIEDLECAALAENIEMVSQ